MGSDNIARRTWLQKQQRTHVVRRLLFVTTHCLVLLKRSRRTYRSSRDDRRLPT